MEISPSNNNNVLNNKTVSISLDTNVTNSSCSKVQMEQKLLGFIETDPNSHVFVFISAKGGNYSNKEKISRPFLYDKVLKWIIEQDESSSAKTYSDEEAMKMVTDTYNTICNTSYKSINHLFYERKGKYFLLHVINLLFTIALTLLIHFFNTQHL